MLRKNLESKILKLQEQIKIQEGVLEKEEFNLMMRRGDYEDKRDHDLKELHNLYEHIGILKNTMSRRLKEIEAAKQKQGHYEAGRNRSVSKSTVKTWFRTNEGQSFELKRSTSVVLDWKLSQ